MVNFLIFFLLVKDGMTLNNQLTIVVDQVALESRRWLWNAMVFRNGMFHGAFAGINQGLLHVECMLNFGLLLPDLAQKWRKRGNCKIKLVNQQPFNRPPPNTHT
jgi:hypothetical protein